MWFNYELIGQVQYPNHKFYFHYCHYWSLLHLRLLLQVICMLFFLLSLNIVFMSLYVIVAIFFWDAVDVGFLEMQP